jgi:hypothetical protein
MPAGAMLKVEDQDRGDSLVAVRRDSETSINPAFSKTASA